MAHSPLELQLAPGGQRADWSLRGGLRSIGGVSDAGVIYAAGRLAIGDVYATHLHAMKVSTGLADHWTRHRGNNANTARLGDL